MLRDFLTNRISAAGLSHVVKAKSQSYRMFWILSTVLGAVMMVLMIYRVFQEYWKYPKASQTKTFSVKQLEFPAVTICSRYLIPRMNVEEANMQAMNNMYPFLESFPNEIVLEQHKKRCHVDPLCKWDRFWEKCRCDKNPCDTPLCYPEKVSDLCNCSKLLCAWDDLNVPEGCQIVKSKGQEYCICRRDFVYSRYNLNESIPAHAFNESYFVNASQEMIDIVRNVRMSQTSDLSDVEQNWIPEVRVLDDFGVSYDSLFVSCAFDEYDCNVKKDITTLYHASYGKCYMFNFVGSGSMSEGKSKIVRHAEKRYGLHLYLQNPRKNMMPFMAIKLGVRIVIHDPFSLPYPREGGFDIRPGDMYSMSLQYIDYNRLGPPWGRCARDGDSSTSGYLETPYNQIACERLCMNKVVFERCRCYSRLHMFGTTMPFGVRVCRPDEHPCFQKVLEDAAANKILCDCPPPCREKRYKVTPSSGKVNKEFFRFLKRAKSLKMVNGTPSVLKNELKLDLMGVFVFYQSMTVSNISETSIYSIQGTIYTTAEGLNTWEFLVANIGGNMGMFLGLSLVTFVEIAEFLVDISIKTFW